MDIFCSECGLMLVAPNEFREGFTHRDGSPECDGCFPIPITPVIILSSN